MQHATQTTITLEADTLTVSYSKGVLTLTTTATPTPSTPKATATPTPKATKRRKRIYSLGVSKADRQDLTTLVQGEQRPTSVYLARYSTNLKRLTKYLNSLAYETRKATGAPYKLRTRHDYITRID
jgi:hypothetical protein